MRYCRGPPHAFAPKAMVRQTDGDEHGASPISALMLCRKSDIARLSPDCGFLGCLPAQPIRSATAASKVQLEKDEGDRNGIPSGSRARLYPITSTGFALYP